MPTMVTTLTLVPARTLASELGAPSPRLSNRTGRRWPIASRLALCLPLALGCGDEGEVSEGSFGQDSAPGLDATAGDAGLATAGTEGGSNSAGPSGSESGSEAGGATSATSSNTSGDTSSTTTGADLPPATCDFTQGCYANDDPRDASVGVNSQVLAGCEGERFRATGAWVIEEMETAGASGIDAALALPVLADFDGDGNLDVVLNIRKGGVGIKKGDGTGDFSGTSLPLESPGILGGGWGPDAGDIDGDGDLDIAVGDHTWSAGAWINNGRGQFTLTADGLRDDDGCTGLGCSVNHHGAGLADLVGDGTLELLLGPDHFSASHVDLATFAGSSWTKQASKPAITGSAGHIQFGDMDGDGDNDVFAFASQLQVFRNNGGDFERVGAFGPQNGASPHQGGVGDIDCDGILDVAAGGEVFFGTGTTFNAGPVVDDATVSHLADMNGDGHLDLVTHSETRGLAMYYNDGTGRTFTREADGLPDESYTQFGGPMTHAYGIDIGDVDQNGNLDIVRMTGIGNRWVLETWSR